MHLSGKGHCERVKNLAQDGKQWPRPGLERRPLHPQSQSDHSFSQNLCWLMIILNDHCQSKLFIRSWSCIRITIHQSIYNELGKCSIEFNWQRVIVMLCMCRSDQNNRMPPLQPNKWYTAPKDILANNVPSWCLHLTNTASTSAMPTFPGKLIYHTTINVRLAFDFKMNNSKMTSCRVD